MKNLLWTLLFIASVGTLFSGEIPLEKLFHSFSGWNPLLHERLPRLLVLIMTGASLAVSGSALQSLFHNPLASPSLLGLSSGSLLAVLIAFLSGWSLITPFAIPVAAVAGAMLSLFIIFFCARLFGLQHTSQLLLLGLALSTLLITLRSIILYLCRENWQLIQTIYEWEAGSTRDRTWMHFHMQFPLTLVGLTICWRLRQELDLLALGEEEASNLGVNVNQVRWTLFFAIALLTGGATAAVGTIYFFGLLLPHLMRMAVGPSSLKLIPLSLLGGAALLTSMDQLIRHLLPSAITIGNVSALLGGLLFGYLILRQSKEALHA